MINKFNIGDRVYRVNDPDDEGVILSLEPSYNIKWDTGTQTYMTQENALRAVSGPSKVVENKQHCVKCETVVWHNINKRLGQTFYRCVRCGNRKGEVVKNEKI